MKKPEPCFIKCPICEQFSFAKFPDQGYCTPCDYREVYVRRLDVSDGLYVDPYEVRDCEAALEEVA